ncbi:MAG: response regulator [Nitrospiraceae bacterium]|nr:MAG: response regulator [Nitrospiraceae bacterium]
MRKPRVIIYDDEITILTVLKDFFSQMNYEVLTYDEPIVCPMYEKNADDCIEHNPCADIMLTDFRMPRMNGIELLEKQSQRGCRAGIGNKAIMTANLDNANKRLIKKLGYAYFKKPFSLKELSDWVKGCENRMDLSRPLNIL